MAHLARRLCRAPGKYPLRPVPPSTDGPSAQRWAQRRTQAAADLEAATCPKRWPGAAGSGSGCTHHGMAHPPSSQPVPHSQRQGACCGRPQGRDPAGPWQGAALRSAAEATGQGALSRPWPSTGWPAAQTMPAYGRTATTPLMGPFTPQAAGPPGSRSASLPAAGRDRNGPAGSQAQPCGTSGPHSPRPAGGQATATVRGDPGAACWITQRLRWPAACRAGDGRRPCRFPAQTFRSSFPVIRPGHQDLA